MKERNLDNPIGCFGMAPQARLFFGANRRQPTRKRAVLLLRRINPYLMTVLPCTTRAHPNDDLHFFRIARGDVTQVLWVKQLSMEELNKRPYSYVFHRHETVPADSIRKIGVVSQDTRMQLAQWLARRCSQNTHSKVATAK